MHSTRGGHLLTSWAWVRLTCSVSRLYDERDILYSGSGTESRHSQPVLQGPDVLLSESHCGTESCAVSLCNRLGLWEGTGFVATFFVGYPIRLQRRLGFSSSRRLPTVRVGQLENLRLSQIRWDKMRWEMLWDERTCLHYWLRSIAFRNRTG